MCVFTNRCLFDLSGLKKQSRFEIVIKFFSKTLKALQAENMVKPCVAVQQLKFKATRLSFLRRLNEMTVLLASELISNAAFIE